MHSWYRGDHCIFIILSKVVKSQPHFLFLKNLCLYFHTSICFEMSENVFKHGVISDKRFHPLETTKCKRNSLSTLLVLKSVTSFRVLSCATGGRLYSYWDTEQLLCYKQGESQDLSKHTVVIHKYCESSEMLRPVHGSGHYKKIFPSSLISANIHPLNMCDPPGKKESG